MSMPAVLVTGASGLIGTNLVEHLLALGCRVIGLAKAFPLKSFGLGPFGHANFVAVLGDVRDRALLEQVFVEYQPTHAVHLAAQAIVGDALSATALTFDTNVRGTWCVLEAARQYGRLKGIVVASSDKAYGEHAVLPYREDFLLRPTHPYDISKKLTEDLALSYFHAHDLPVAITRCGNVFGPYDFQVSRIVPGTILSCLEAKPVILRSSGKNERCYLHAHDVVRAYFSIMMEASGVAAGQVFNVGNERAVSALDIVEVICQKMCSTPPRIVIQNAAENELSRQSLDCRKIHQLLDWKERLTLEEGLDQTISWYTEFCDGKPRSLPWMDAR